MADEQTQFDAWITEHPGSHPLEIALGARLSGRSIDVLVAAGQADNRLWLHSPFRGHAPHVWARHQVDTILDVWETLRSRGWTQRELLALEDKTLRDGSGE